MIPVISITASYNFTVGVRSVTVSSAQSVRLWSLQRGLLRRLRRDGKLIDKTVLGYYSLLPIAFDFIQIPLCGNISTAQIVSLARRQVLYRRSRQLNSGVNWRVAAGLVVHVRLNSAGVDEEDLDSGILYKNEMRF